MRPWIILGWLLLSLGCVAQGPTNESEPAPKEKPLPLKDATEEAGPPLPRQVERPRLDPRMPGVDVTVVAAAFSPDGRYVVSVNGDGSLTLWDTTQDQAPPPRGSSSELKFKGIREYASDYWATTPPDALAFSADGKSIYCARAASVWRWDRDTGRGRRLFRYFPESDRFQSVRQPAGPWVVLAGRERGVAIWDMYTGRRTELATDERELGVEVAPDGKRALLVDKRGVAEEWDLTASRRLRVLNPRPGGWFLDPNDEPGIMSIVYVPGSRKAVSAQWGSRVIRVWELDSGRVLRTIDLGKDVESASILAVSPDGKRLACRTNAKGVKVCDLEAGPVLHAVNDYDAYPSVLRFSPDGKFLLVGGYRNRAPQRGAYTEDRVLLLWDVEKERLVRTLAYP